MIGVPPGLVGVEQGLEAFLVQAAVPAAGEELTGADGAVGAGQKEAPALLGLAGAVAAGQAGDLQERLGLGGRFIAGCLLIDPAGKGHGADADGGALLAAHGEFARPV